MPPNFVTLMEAAELVGRAGAKGRTWLKRHILTRQEETGRVILHGTKTHYVNVSDLRHLCPELFPIEHHRECAELRAELRRNREVEAQLEAQMDQLADATYALYEEFLDRSDHQRSPAITPSTMDEGATVSLFPKLEEDETSNGATHGPTISHCAESAPAPRH